MSTYGTIRPEIERITGNRVDSDSQAVVKAMTTHALRILARGREWPELQTSVTLTTVAGTSSYSYTTIGFTRLHKIYNVTLLASDEKRPIAYYTPARWDKEILPLTSASATGRPTVYTDWGRSIEFFRTPDSAYRIKFRYYQYPQPIVDDTTNIDLEDVDDIVVFLAAGLSFAAWEQFQEAAQWLRLSEMLARARDIDITSVFNFQAADVRKMAESVGTSVYWKDPFERRNP